MMFGGVLLNIVAYVAYSLFLFFIFFLIRLALRKQWLAVLVSLSFVSLISVWGDHRALHTTYEVVIWGVGLVVLIRYGLLALVMALCTQGILEDFPLTAHLSAWYAEPTIFVFSIILAAAIFGFYTSTAGKPRLGGLSIDA